MTDTLPYRWYTDPELLEQERTRLFASAWQYAGHSGELAKPGSYLTLRAGEIPLVVVRDRDGTLRAFVNVCRHRGAEVVKGSGTCSTLQCHYHAWTYGLDGKLRAAPRSEADPEFDARGSSVSSRLRSIAGGRWCSSMPTPPRRRSPTRSGSCRRSSAAVASISTPSASTSACRSRSTPTGRSPSRTTSSATTAQSPTRASAR